MSPASIAGPLVTLVAFTLASCEHATEAENAAISPVFESSASTKGYEAIDLGTLGGDPSYAMKINARGQVVGWSRTESGARRAFLWEDGVMTELSTLGGSRSDAMDINARGQVVGSITLVSGYTHAFLWENGVMTDLGTLEGGQSWGWGIDAGGQVVGWSTTASWESHAFLWKNGVMTDLGTLEGTEESLAADLNPQGQVVGWSFTDPTGPSHGFLWERGEMTDLGRGMYARSINAHGQVVGNRFTESGLSRAFLWEDGVMTDLGDLGGGESDARDINDRGQVTGWSRITSGGTRHAFLWENGVMTDLGTLEGGTGGIAIGINALGQVVGYGRNESGELPAILWTPKP
jgi:probable HAF family extracellular repeat protein